MPLQPAAELILTAEKPVAGGRMLARHEGQIVFVAGAIAGERVRARVERVSRQLAFAETIDVLDASPDRRASTVDPACGGSLYAHIAYARQLSLKSELIVDAFARIAKVALAKPVEVMASPEDGYRMRARLHARNGRIGFFREGTHQLCDAGLTRQLLPAAIDALKRLESSVMREAGTKGTAVSCELSENVPADERAVAIEYDNGRIELAPGYDSPSVTDRLNVAGAAVILTRHVQSFFQGNRWLLEPLAARVLAHVPDGRVIDLYAGAGLFAVSLAASGRCSITAVEGDRFSAHDLKNNAAPFAGVMTVRHTSVEQFLASSAIRDAHTAVLDPPRTGVSGEAISGILALKVPRVVYVSCDVATLARDVKRFVQAGYRLEHIEAFDLFPNTAHIETLAVLVR